MIPNKIDNMNPGIDEIISSMVGNPGIRCLEKAGQTGPGLGSTHEQEFNPFDPCMQGIKVKSS